MPRGPVLSIKLNAGTTEFFADIEKANAKIVQFGKSAENAGHGAVSGMQATSASLRVLEGGITNNLRAAERFAANVLNLGPILQAAFPVIGGIAFLGLLSKLGEEVKKFYTEMRDAPEKMAGSFRGLTAAENKSVDDLEANLARVNNEVNRLEGKRQNYLQQMLVDAKVAADGLADSLNKSFQELSKSLDENKVSTWWGLLTGQGNTFNVKQMAGGYTGTAGIQTKLADAEQAGRLAIAQARNAEELAVAEKQRDAAIQKILNEAQTDANRLLTEYRNIQAGLRADGSKFAGNLGGGSHVDESANIAQMERFIATISARSKAVEIDAQIREATRKRDQLQIQKDDSKVDRPYERKIQELTAQLKGLHAEVDAVGQSEGAQILAKAFGESEKAIAEIDVRLRAINPKLGVLPAQAEALRAIFKDIAGEQIELGWKTRAEETTDSLRAQTKAQEALTAAIGQGYEQVKKAAVEARVVESVGPKNYFTPGFDQNGADIQKIRAAATADYEAKHNAQVQETIQRLHEEIELEKALAGVQADGAEAVRQAGLEVKLRYQLIKDGSAEQIQLERDKYAAERQNISSETIAKIDDKVAATNRLTQAILRGAEAVRQANLENRLVEIRRGGGGPDEEAAARREDQADHAQDVAKDAIQADRIKAIDEQVRKLNEVKAVYGDTLAIEAQLKNLENERLQAMSDQLLALGSARDGFEAFFLDIQKDGENAARAINRAMHSSLDDISENLAKTFTGQKTSWAKNFQQIGTQLLSSEIKTSLSGGLGFLGKLLHIGGDHTDQLGTKGNPMWVTMANADGAFGIPTAAGAGSNGPSWAGGGSGGDIFSGGLGMIFHSLGFGGGRAAGGSVSPGSIYMVGEDGPEPFIPSQSGTILPHGSLGGNTVVNYHIDARGGDLGAYNRIARGMAMTHDKAVAHAVQAQHERGKRTPGK